MERRSFTSHVDTCLARLQIGQLPSTTVYTHIYIYIYTYIGRYILIEYSHPMRVSRAQNSERRDECRATCTTGIPCFSMKSKYACRFFLFLFLFFFANMIGHYYALTSVSLKEPITKRERECWLIHVDTRRDSRRIIYLGGWNVSFFRERGEEEVEVV